MGSHSESLFGSFLEVSKHWAEYDALLKMSVYDKGVPGIFVVIR